MNELPSGRDRSSGRSRAACGYIIVKRFAVDCMAVSAVIEVMTEHCAEPTQMLMR